MNNFCEITRRVIATIHNTKKKDSIHMITMSSHVMTPTIYFHIELQLFSNVYKKYSWKCFGNEIWYDIRTEMNLQIERK